MKLLLFIILLLSFSISAPAQYYRCVDDKGVTIISHFPCNDDPEIISEKTLGIFSGDAEVEITQQIDLEMMDNPVQAMAVFEKASQNSAIIRMHDEDQNVSGLGSGVVLSDERVATNCHFVNESYSFSVVYRQTEYTAEQLDAYLDRDVCIVSAVGLMAPDIDFGSTEDLQVGTRVYAVGATQDQNLTLLEGIVSRLPMVATGRLIQVSMPVEISFGSEDLPDYLGLETVCVVVNNRIKIKS